MTALASKNSPEIVGPTGAGPDRRRINWGRLDELLRFVPAGIVAACALMTIWSRLLPLPQSLWLDEWFSVTEYINRGPGDILGPGHQGIFGGFGTNDHPLFELLSWLTTSITGDHTEAAYRFWGVIPGVAAGVLVTWWLWRRLGSWVAAMFALLATAAPLYYADTIEARGYGLAFLGGALMLIGADRFVRAHSRRGLAVFGLGAVLGLWSITLFALAFAAMSALIIFYAGSVRRWALIAVGAVVLASAAFYSPMLGDVLSSSSSPFAQHQAGGGFLAWHGFVTGPLRYLVAPEVQLLIHGTSLALAEVAGGLVVLLGAATLVKTERFLMLAIAVPSIFAYGALEVGHIAVTPRFVSFQLLPLLVLCAVACVQVGRIAARFGSAHVAKVIVLPAAVGVAVFVLAQFDSLVQSTIAAPYENSKEVATLITGSNVQDVVSNATGPDVANYLGGQALDQLPAPQLEALFCSGAAPFIYLRQRPATDDPSTACLVQRHAIRISVPQRHQNEARSGSPFVVWLVPGAGVSPLQTPPPSVAPPIGATIVRCRRVIRGARPTNPQVSTVGSPVPISVLSRLRHGVPVPVRLTILQARFVGFISRTSGPTPTAFVSPGGYVAVKYRLVNDGTAALDPLITVNGIFGLSEGSGGLVQQVGSFDRPCATATDAYAASEHVASPSTVLAPGAALETVAVYPLPSPPTSVTPFLLAWTSPAQRLTIPLLPGLVSARHG